MLQSSTASTDNHSAANDMSPVPSQRQFVADVRAELAALNRSDVKIERAWIDVETEGYPFLLHVPIGTELSVPLMASDGLEDPSGEEERARRACEFATALINLREGDASLIKYAREMRKAVNAAIANAREDGLDLLLSNIGFKPVYASNLDRPSVKDALSYVIAAATIRNLSFYLQPEFTEICIEEIDDVDMELASLITDQRERQERLEQLEEMGADLIVDATTLELLGAFSLPTKQILSQVWKKQSINLTVQHLDQPAQLSLTSSNGVVTGSLHMSNAFWNGTQMWFRDEQTARVSISDIGGTLGVSAPHPVFADSVIRDFIDVPGGSVTLEPAGHFQFDADTGALQPVPKARRHTAILTGD